MFERTRKASIALLLAATLSTPTVFADPGGGATDWWQTVVQWVEDLLPAGSPEESSADGEMGPLIEPGG